ncbi:PrpF protein [Cantharellus anzutake]|uniref:PrpF protein n=1 Tax=Cantharellus anzutake TaxID=1750568 RepID=UPI001907A7B2|nr:PrpF protein [Cantharellus anzutake]KAF8326123.1 PrpF protein [Cantharellus anzutake]
MLRAIKASFYRGGTSKGLFFRASDLAPFPQSMRNEILLSAMGSPDPDGRQIDGMGGGISSLSKAVVLSTPGEAVSEMSRGPEYSFPDGVDWVDDVSRASSERSGWDVVYRFAQVGVRDFVVDWSSTCGNLVAAVAQYAVDEGLVQKRIEASIQGQTPPERFPFATRILAADSGKIIHATTVVCTPGSLESGRLRWYVSNFGGASISGVPSTSSPVEIENPLQGNMLPTGRVLDAIPMEGKSIPCTIVDAGLPSIFIPSSAVFSVPEWFLSHPADLDADPRFRARAEELRYAASRLSPALSSIFSTSTPKICVIGSPASYRTTSGEELRSNQMDCVIRAVSVGNFHRTVPATMVSALAVASVLPGSVVWDACQASVLPQEKNMSFRSITVGQPAGLSKATVALDIHGQPKSINYVRTARRLFQGEVLVKA